MTKRFTEGIFIFQSRYYNLLRIPGSLPDNMPHLELALALIRTRTTLQFIPSMQLLIFSP